MLIQFVLLFLPVALGALGLAVLRTQKTVGIAMLIVAGIWILAAFVVRHRHEVR